MKLSKTWIAGAGLMGLLLGCHAPMGQWKPALDDMARNAAVRQQTLYDHHFRAGTAELNAAGQSRLLHVARWAHPDVPLVMVASDWRQPALTEARAQRVAQALAAMNVGARPLDVRTLDVPVWSMWGEEAVISVQGMLTSLATSRAGDGEPYSAENPSDYGMGESD